MYFSHFFVLLLVSYWVFFGKGGYPEAFGTLPLSMFSFLASELGFFYFMTMLRPLHDINR